MSNITLAITNFNGEEVILRTLASAKSMAYPISEILVVDDGSTDQSVELVTAHHPEARIVRLPRNTARLNLVRNVAVEASETRLVFLVDNDVTFHPDCLSHLIEAMDSLPGAAVCTPVILQDDDKRTIYGGGHDLHYLCISTDELRGTQVTGGIERKPRRSVGGGIQLIDKRALENIGFFNENFELGWGDDGELHHRVNLAGLSCYAVPGAVVYHEPRQRAPRTYGQLHNRWLTLLQSYSTRTILVLLPALLAYELGLLAFLVKRGESGQYWRALRAVGASRSRWLAERARIRTLRARGDRELLVSGRIYVPRLLLRGGWEKVALRFLDALFGIYWRATAWLI